MEVRLDPTTLLDWATSHMDPNAPPSEPKKWDPIQKKIFDIMLQPDAEKMKFLVKVFTEKEYSLEEKEAAVEELQFYVEQQENAVDLHHPTVNGLVPVLDGLKSPHAGIRWRCAWVLATMLQNNPKSQEHVLSCQGLSRFIEALKWEVAPENAGDLEVLGKLIYAISGLLTYQTKSQKEFWSLGGFSSLVSILNIDSTRLEAFRKNKEPIESPSGKLAAEPKEETLKELEKEDKNIVATIEVVDEEEKVRDVALRIRKQKQEKEEITLEEVHKLWVRLSSKVVFLLYKMMVQSEQFKLAFIKDQQSEVLTSLLHLLEHQEDLDLKDKILIALDTIASSTNHTVQNYILSALKQPQFALIEKLIAQKNKFSASENLEDYDGLLNKIQTLLQRLQ